MKRLLILALFIAVGTTSFAQGNGTSEVITPDNAIVKNKRTYKHSLDYSVRNYKHADKAAWAAKNNTDKIVTLDNATVTDQGSYKHSFAHKTKKKAVVSTLNRRSSPAASHKHPLGI